MNAEMKLAVLGSPGYLGSRGATPEEFLGLVGNNTGNLIFQWATAGLLGGRLQHLSKQTGGYVTDPDCAALVFPAANHLRPSGVTDSFVSYLESVRLPVAVIGLGTQSTLDERLPEIVSAILGDPVLSRFADWLRKRAVFVGVRGAQTLAVCQELGVPAVVTGCPSWFINLKSDLGAHLEAQIFSLANNEAQERSAVAVTADAPFEAFNSGPDRVNLERKLFALAVATKGLHVQQSGGTEAISLSAGDLRNVSVKSAMSIRNMWRPDSSVDEFLRGCGEVCRVYWDARTWVEELRRCSVSVGVRMHGNMAAIAAGLPGICIVHDGRTSELVNTMSLPYIALTDAHLAEGLEGLLKVTHFDGSEFDRRRMQTADILYEGLSEAGLPLAERFLEFAEASRSRLARGWLDDSQNEGTLPNV